MTEDENAERFACAWSDYRSEYGASGIDAHADFTHGWEAARDNHTVIWDLHSMDYRSGFEAFHGSLDIGGVMR